MLPANATTTSIRRVPNDLDLYVPLPIDPQECQSPARARRTAPASGQRALEPRLQRKGRARELEQRQQLLNQAQQRLRPDLPEDGR